MTKTERRSNERCKLLWSAYQKNGKLTCKEIKRLTGQSHIAIYKTFQLYGLEGPPIYDTKAALRERKIKRLRDKAAELGRDYLTPSEAAQALGVASKQISSINRDLKGYNIPKIIFKRGGARNIKFRDDDDIIPDGPRSKTDNYHSRGLPVSACRPGPEPGQVIYTLK